MPECLECGQQYIDKKLAVYGLCKKCEKHKSPGCAICSTKRLPGADYYANKYGHSGGIGIGIDGRSVIGKWPDRWNND
jgi:hypothetical protein